MQYIIDLVSRITAKAYSQLSTASYAARGPANAGSAASSHMYEVDEPMVGHTGQQPVIYRTSVNGTQVVIELNEPHVQGNRRE